jgi:DNA sulfur modification protein DndB
MGRWVYYAAVVTLADIAERVEFAEVVHGRDRELNELIQRALEKRSVSIAEYLIRQKKDRFFNSLVVGLYNGNPDWYYASLHTHERLDIRAIPDYGRHALGLLSFDGSERLFALDGQHRVAGIREALTQSPELGGELVTVLFVSHKNTKSGLERTRRLFTTLNRYAKPVAKAELIALDEDDAVAIVTRRLITEHPLFSGRTSTKRPKSIPPSDKRSVTTITALYDALNIYLRFVSKATNSEWKSYKRFRRRDDELAELTASAMTVWTRFAKALPSLRSVIEGGPEVPGTLRRKKDGGDVWLRPIGTMILLSTLVALRGGGLSEPTAIGRLAAMPSALGSLPWLGLLWDSTNHRMITRAENRRVAIALAAYQCGGDIQRLKYSKQKLEEEWTGLVGEARRLSQLARQS